MGSESIEDVTGHPVAELVGAAAFDLVHPDDLGPLADLVTAEIANPTANGVNGDPAAPPSTWFVFVTSTAPSTPASWPLPIFSLTLISTAFS